MMDFKGFDGWIEIFRGGRQIDSTGRPHDGTALIEQALAAFNPEDHEPPLVVGHPKDNAPAFGWVEALRKIVRDGVAVLEAKFRQVAPEFETLVRRGRFKKRSASFYPDGRLRHVGFLGAAPPSVKGLADVAFARDDALVFEFGQGEEAGEKKFKISKIRRNEFMDVKGKIKALFARAVDELPEEEFWEGEPHVFSESEVKAREAAAAKDAAAKARAEAEAEFAQKKAAEAGKLRQAETKERLDQLIEKGLVPPAAAAGLPEFMSALPADEIEFGEGDDRKKQSPIEFMFDFLERLKKLELFEEIAAKDRAGELSGSEKDARLGKSIAAKVNPRAAG